MVLLRPSQLGPVGAAWLLSSASADAISTTAVLTALILLQRCTNQTHPPAVCVRESESVLVAAGLYSGSDRSSLVQSVCA